MAWKLSCLNFVFCKGNQNNHAVEALYKWKGQIIKTVFTHHHAAGSYIVLGYIPKNIPNHRSLGTCI